MNPDPKNHQNADFDGIAHPETIKVGIVVAEWNTDITAELARACAQTFVQFGIKEKHIFVQNTPGSFELPLAAQWLYEAHTLDAVVCIGCLIKGDTPHFEYICEAVSQGIMKLNLRYKTPFVFGILTTLTHAQAQERTGGIHGHKGTEAAITALKMIELSRSLPLKNRFATIGQSTENDDE
jgi:6,7-dimethyl-8-ribityllumazine synthase